MHPRLRFVSFVRAGAAAMLLSTAAQAGTIFVDGGGGGDYTTISAAVANANPGDVIIVAPGTYVEEVLVDVPVTITGSGVGQTIVMPATSNPGTGTGSQVGTTSWLFRIQANDVTITGISMDGNNPALGTGIDARGGIITDNTAGTFGNLEVLSCELANFVYRAVDVAAGGTGHSVLLNEVRSVNALSLDSAGIFLSGAQAVVQNNEVTDCAIAIGFHQGGGGTIAGNTIADSELGILTSEGSSPVVIQNNTITGCDQGVQSLAPDTTVSVTANDVTGCVSGLVFLGGGTGSNLADGNEIDGLGGPGTSGIFVSTDASPHGYGNVTVSLINNVLSNNHNAVVLNEHPFNNAWLLNCSLSGAADTYNSFWGSLAFNVLLQNCQDDVDARHNMWGAVNNSLIENTLWHHLDDPALGTIDYSNTVNLYITVDDDGPADFTAVNPAVQSLLPGGTIKVMPGLYQEDFVFDRSCIVEGSGTDPDTAVGTTFRGYSIGFDMDVITVTAPDVHIENLRIDGYQPIFNEADHCVYASGVSGLNVSDCVIHTAITGIYYDASTQGSFQRNEVYDFGVNMNIGGGIHLASANADVGVLGNGNDVHDGLSPGIIFTEGSSGLAAGNRVDNCPLGLLVKSADEVTTFQANEVRNCPQAFQAIGNLAPVSFLENTVYDCDMGFVQYGLGNQLHTFTDNFVHQRLGTTGSIGFFITTECPLGDDNARARLSGNVISGADYGIVLDESATSLFYFLDADLSGGANPNWITGAAVQDILMQVCNDDVDATGNYFGSTEAAVVEGKITHGSDNGALGVVDFSGLVAAGPDIRRRGEIGQGREIALITTGLPGDLAAPFYAYGPSFIPTAWGTVLIDPVTAVLLSTGFVGASGLSFYEAPVSIKLPVGFTFYLQALGGRPGGWKLTINADTVTVH